MTYSKVGGFDSSHPGNTGTLSSSRFLNLVLPFQGVLAFDISGKQRNNLCKTLLHSTKLGETMLLLNPASHLRLVESVLLHSNLANEFLCCLSLVFGFSGRQILQSGVSQVQLVGENVTLRFEFLDEVSV